MLLNILLSFLCLLLGNVWCCPREEVIAPDCICKDLGNGAMMLCSNMMNAEQLIPPIKATDSLPMFSLSIINSSLLYIPSGIFRNTKYQKIRFSNSQIMSLSDTDLAFEGLEDSLEEIRAEGAHYITEWDWSQLRNHRRLQHIDIHMISMYSVDQEFPHLESLQLLGISKAEISFLHPTAFVGLKNLKLFVLEDNEISEMKRSMFPDLANDLTLINLSGNKLSSFPENMFSNMPSLKELDLSNNKFLTLNEDTFQPLFERLETIVFKGNEFQCDCRMRWLVESRKPSAFEATCFLPKSLKDVPLQYLSHNVLYC